MSLQIKRNDVSENNPTISIACRLAIASEDINLIEVIPKELDDYLFFVLIITNTTEGNSIAGCLKTKNNINEHDIIFKGTYFCTYLIPQYFPVLSLSLTLHDMFDENKIISIRSPQFFNELFISQLVLPTGTIIFN